MPLPFHRVKSRTQTDEVAVLQVASLEIWGKETRFGGEPIVQAYKNARTEPGVEFDTDVPPQPLTGPLHARWYGGRPGVLLRCVDGVDFACIPCTQVISYQP